MRAVWRHHIHLHTLEASPTFIFYYCFICHTVTHYITVNCQFTQKSMLSAKNTFFFMFSFSIFFHCHRTHRVWMDHKNSVASTHDRIGENYFISIRMQIVCAHTAQCMWTMHKNLFDRHLHRIIQWTTPKRQQKGKIHFVHNTYGTRTPAKSATRRRDSAYFNATA